jgi:serine/threonine protein kinase
MGQKGAKHSKFSKNPENIILSPNLFEFKYIIGKGGFGKVWKVVLKKTNELYALKEMSKAKIIDKKSEKAIKYERDLLVKIKHPFIVNMHFAFQDKEYLYIVMDLLTGGDLRYHVSKNKKFNEEQTKFFLCCLILGLEFLHCNNILHRDIKPENLVLEDTGYVRITDFGIAKIYQKENSSETSGTPGYMSPEVIMGRNHTHAVDYFALGVITYEFMLGRRPYNGKNRREIKEKIFSKQVQIQRNEIPKGWSMECADFINRLLQRKPANRLGLSGACEVKEHPWLKNYKWKELYEKKIIAPFIPPPGDNFDSKYCTNDDNQIPPEIKFKYEKILNDPLNKDSFKDFDFYGEYLEEFKKKNKGKEIHNGINMINNRFKNPHEQIHNYVDKRDQSIIDIGLNDSLILGGGMNIMDLLSNPENNTYDKNSEIEFKFKKKKQQTYNAANNNLIRSYNKQKNKYSNIAEIIPSKINNELYK